MSNIAFVTTNLVPAAATIRNGGAAGSAGAAPARIENAPFTMDQLLIDDRSPFWQYTGPADAYAAPVDIDLGADVTFDTIILSGIRYAGTADLSNLVFYATSSASGYKGAGLPTDASWGAALGSIAGVAGAKPADVALRMGGALARRYLRIEVNWLKAGVLAFGHLKLGVRNDIGIYCQGERNSPDRARVISGPGSSGATSVDDLGLVGGPVVLPFRSLTATLVDQLMAFNRFSGLVTYLDPEDRAYEGWMSVSKERRILTNLVALWDVNVEFEALA